MNNKKREFYIDDDGIRLHAKIDMLPGMDEGDKCPLIIIIHGLTGNMEEPHLKAIVKLVNEMGFAALRAEMYGHGKSDGDFEKHNIFKWLNNAMAVTDYAKSLDFVSDLYVLGHSQGGVTAMLLAGLKPGDFKAVIPLSPATKLVYEAKDNLAFGIRFDIENMPGEFYVNPFQKVSSNYVRAAQLIDIDEAIDNYKGPVLIVHGSDDEAVPVHYAKEAAELYAGAELVIIEGDDHGFNEHPDIMLGSIRNFLEKVVQKNF